MKKVLFFVLGVGVVAFGWWTLSPLFLDKQVEEELPFDSSQLQAPKAAEPKPMDESMTLEEFDEMLAFPSDEEIDAMTEEEKEELMETTMAKIEAMPSVKVEEPTPVQPTESAPISQPSVQEEMPEEEPEPEPEPEPELTDTEPEPTGPVLIGSGTFAAADSTVHASGSAQLIKLEDGSHFLRFEDLNVSNGPDLYVYLVEKASPKNAADINAGSYQIARLKGNVGNQNYTIPEGIDISKYQSVAIHCRAFSHLFAVATWN